MTLLLLKMNMNFPLAKMISVIIQVVLFYISNTAEYPDRISFIFVIYSWLVLRKQFAANVTKLDQLFFIYLDRKDSNDAIKLLCLIISRNISCREDIKEFHAVRLLYCSIMCTRECANKLQVLIRTRYTGVIAFNGPVSLCFFSGSEFSLVAFHPRNANALLFHFSLCYRCKNKVHRSFNQAEKSYHDGRHSFLLQEKRFRVFQSFLPAPPLFYASSETRIIIVPLQPPFSISFHSLIIPTGMSSNRFR